jgi:hypothetical protein
MDEVPIVNLDAPIVFCLHGMNISCWSHMSDMHRKRFFYYRNIILCQLGGPHCQLTLGLNIFSNETQNAQDRVEPMTPWSLHDYTTNLLLHLCCRVTYYFFVLCSVYSFCLVSTVVKFKPKFKFKSKLKFKFKFNFLQIYSKFCLN